MQDFINEFFWLVLGFSFLVLLLNTILFFKIWGMTNNVSRMRKLLQEWLDLEHPVIENNDKKPETPNIKSQEKKTEEVVENKSEEL
jgi:Na+-transporting methylmalonyl-CoA/oxaloacetate decarboxylase gamma subunit